MNTTRSYAEAMGFIKATLIQLGKELQASATELKEHREMIGTLTVRVDELVKDIDELKNRLHAQDTQPLPAIPARTRNRIIAFIASILAAAAGLIGLGDKTP